jgi:hypothetical protein
MDHVKELRKIIQAFDDIGNRPPLNLREIVDDLEKTLVTEAVMVADVGTSFGIVAREKGVVTYAIRRPGEEAWPHGVEPTTGKNTILEGYTRYHHTFYD